MCAKDSVAFKIYQVSAMPDWIQLHEYMSPPLVVDFNMLT